MEALQNSQAKLLQLLGEIAQQQQEITFRQLVAASELRLWTERGTVILDRNKWEASSRLMITNRGLIPIALGHWRITFGSSGVKSGRLRLSREYGDSETASRHTQVYMPDNKLGTEFVYGGRREVTIDAECSVAIAHLHVAFEPGSSGHQYDWSFSSKYKTFSSDGPQKFTISGDVVQ